MWFGVMPWQRWIRCDVTVREWHKIQSELSRGKGVCYSVSTSVWHSSRVSLIFLQLVSGPTLLIAGWS